MSRKRNIHGSRLERENKFAAELGLGTGRTFMGACLSAYESGDVVEIVFRHPGDPTECARFTAQLPAPAQDGEK